MWDVFFSFEKSLLTYFVYDDILNNSPGLKTYFIIVEIIIRRDTASNAHKRENRMHF